MISLWSNRVKGLMETGFTAIPSLKLSSVSPDQNILLFIIKSNNSQGPFFIQEKMLVGFIFDFEKVFLMPPGPTTKKKNYGPNFF